jgi:aspartate carbamoyltransferase catalytic subunit
MSQAPQPILKSSRLLGVDGLPVGEITALLDLTEQYVALGRAKQKKTALLQRRMVQVQMANTLVSGECVCHRSAGVHT